MEYLKRLPILLSLLTTTSLAMYYLHEQKYFLDVYIALIICFVVSYIMGKFIRSNYIIIINESKSKKDKDENKDDDKGEEKFKQKEGNSDIAENKEIEG